MINGFIGKFLPVVTNQQVLGCLIIPIGIGIKLIIDNLEMASAACFFRGNIARKKNVITLWKKAMKMREEQSIKKLLQVYNLTFYLQKTQDCSRNLVDVSVTSYSRRSIYIQRIASRDNFIDESLQKRRF
jgi:hypothetical protein